MENDVTHQILKLSYQQSNQEQDCQKNFIHDLMFAW